MANQRAEFPSFNPDTVGQLLLRKILTIFNGSSYFIIVFTLPNLSEFSTSCCEPTYRIRCIGLNFPYCGKCISKLRSDSCMSSPGSLADNNAGALAFVLHQATLGIAAYCGE